MGDDGLLSTSREHHLEQKPLKYLKMRPGISPVHMGPELVEHDSQAPVLGWLGRVTKCLAGPGWYDQLQLLICWVA